MVKYHIPYTSGYIINDLEGTLPSITEQFNDCSTEGCAIAFHVEFRQKHYISYLDISESYVPC